MPTRDPRAAAMRVRSSDRPRALGRSSAQRAFGSWCARIAGRLVGARPDTHRRQRTQPRHLAPAPAIIGSLAPDCGWLLIPRSMAPARRHDPRPVRL